jgi:hypothetical protein
VSGGKPGIAPATNAGIVAGFLADMRRASLPADVLSAAKMCLVDWIAVCIGARDTPEAAALARFAEGAGCPGYAYSDGVACERADACRCARSWR